jgi:rhodanese-related sulfurtransferase
MNKFIKIILISLLAAAPTCYAAEKAEPAKTENPTARPYSAKSPKLNRAQIDALLARPSDILFIDVRRPDEISKIGSFPVYLNIQASELEKSLAFIPKDRTLITVSNHAGRAGAAADLLADKGFKVAGAVGSQNYEEEGGKISKVAIPAPKTDAPAAGEEHKHL